MLAMRERRAKKIIRVAIRERERGAKMIT